MRHGQQRVRDQRGAAQRESGFGPENKMTSIHRVGQRAPDKREHDHRHEFGYTEQTNEQGRVRELVNLPRQYDVADGVAESGNELRDEEQPIVARGAQRREVERRGLAQTLPPAARCWPGWTLTHTVQSLIAARSEVSGSRTGVNSCATKPLNPVAEIARMMAG